MEMGTERRCADLPQQRIGRRDGEERQQAGSAEPGGRAFPEVPLWPHLQSLPNTRDKLRGARSSTLVLRDGKSVAANPYHTPLRLRPPLVSFIALFDGMDCYSGSRSSS